MHAALLFSINDNRYACNQMRLSNILIKTLSCILLCYFHSASDYKIIELNFSCSKEIVEQNREVTANWPKNSERQHVSRNSMFQEAACLTKQHVLETITFNCNVMGFGRTAAMLFMFPPGLCANNLLNNFLR